MPQNEAVQDLRVRKVADFGDLAPGLTLTSVSLDRDGNPVILFEEGRPPFPTSRDRAEMQAWYKKRPSAHHVVHLIKGKVERITFVNHTKTGSTRFAQPHNDGWMLADSRDGSARFYDFSGNFLRVIDIGDAVNSVQTTEQGAVWVSYFDEGVFWRGGIGQNGLVCFDSTGAPVFKFAELAGSENLPPIDDCYALNVCQDCVWLSYYSNFPLVSLREFQVERNLDLGIAFSTFAVRQETILYKAAYGDQLVHVLDLASGDRRDLNPIDEQGRSLSGFRGRNYEFVASHPDSLKYGNNLLDGSSVGPVKWDEESRPGIGGACG